MVSRQLVEHYSDSWAALIIDDKYTYHFLDWATSEDLGDLILFLLSYDSFRFSVDSSDLRHTKFSADILAAALHHLSAHPKLLTYLSKDLVKDFRELVAAKVPFMAILSCVCDALWDIYRQNLRKIYDSPSFASLKRLIINGAEIDLRTIVASPKLKKVFEQFVDGKKDIMSSYSCWQIAIQALENIKSHKIETVADPVSPAVEAGAAVAEPPNNPSSGFFSSLFGSKSLPAASAAAASAAVKPSVPPLTTKTSAGSLSSPAGAAQTPPPPPQSAGGLPGASAAAAALGIFGGGATEARALPVSDNTDYYSVMGPCPEYDLSNPYEPFGFLISAARLLQRQLAASPVASHSEHLASHRGSMSAATNAAEFQSSSATSARGGMSEATRLELQSVLTITAAVRNAASVESVEIGYARICTQRLARLIHNIEKETFECLEIPFAKFCESNYYFDLIAIIRCEESSKVVAYDKKVSFLHQVTFTCA